MHRMVMIDDYEGANESNTNAATVVFWMFA